MSIFFGKHWNLIFDQKNSKYQKAVSSFFSRHRPSFHLMVVSTKSDDFYFRVFTSGLLKCDFLELRKTSKFCFRQKTLNIFLRMLSNLYCILKFNLGALGLWRAKTLKLGGFWQFYNILVRNTKMCFRQITSIIVFVVHSKFDKNGMWALKEVGIWNLIRLF